MATYLSSSYGVILLLWGVVFELLGIAAMYLIYRAVQRDDANAHNVVETVTPPTTRPEAVPAPANQTVVGEPARTLPQPAANREPELQRRGQAGGDSLRKAG